MSTVPGGSQDSKPLQAGVAVAFPGVVPGPWLLQLLSGFSMAAISVVTLSSQQNKTHSLRISAGGSFWRDGVCLGRQTLRRVQLVQTSAFPLGNLQFYIESRRKRMCFFKTGNLLPLCCHARGLYSASSEVVTSASCFTLSIL